MKKLKTILKKVLTSKALLVPAAMVAIVAGAAGFTAFEAHVINVTAKIENALAVNTEPITFGTVFPEEAIDKTLQVNLSASFKGQGRVNTVNYVINQKPKCEDPQNPGVFGRVKESQSNFECEDLGFVKLPVLCPFLSKTTTDQGDQSRAAFHGSLNWTVADTLANSVSASLTNVTDIADQWTIDLKVPCFQGQCAEDNFVPAHLQLDPLDESKTFGCDLWVEVTGIN